MAKQKEEIVRLNPKAILRALIKSLPDACNEQDAHTVTALWAYSDEFIKAEDVEANSFMLTGTVSYGQLGDFCCMTAAGMKKRMKKLRDMGIVSWKVSQHGIKFEVASGVPTSMTDYTHTNHTTKINLLESTTREARVTDASATRPGSYLEDVEVATRKIEVATPGSEAGTGVPPLALDLALSGEEQLADADASFLHGRQQSKTTPTPRATPTPATKPTLGSAAPPVELESLVKENGDPEKPCYIGLNQFNPVVGPHSRKAFDTWFNKQLPEVFQNPSKWLQAPTWDKLRKVVDMVEPAELVFRGVSVQDKIDERDIEAEIV